MQLIWHAGICSVNRLVPDADISNWTDAELPLLAITRERGMWTVVCPTCFSADARRRDEVGHASQWRCLEIAGTLEFEIVGILAELSGVLARAEIPIYVISSHTTDYILVPDHNGRQAVDALTRSGHRVSGVPPVDA